ncbi:hypothetical protein SK128_014740 [Halocaridina rubra]|uniref:SCP domain-containing protein n=1 Tax=Halocaridina rubra TaxID=373956 RepID=A0AAN8ZRV9_HALRR
MEMRCLRGSAVAKAWYETGRTFKYNVNESADLAHAGPFSQVVWESTEAVGIGFARGTDGRTVVVARYCPPGNIGGQFSANVKPSLEETVNMNANLGPVMSRTRQEAHFYVSIALEPPGKTKKGEKEKLTSGLKFPRKKLTSESVSSETLLMQSATVDSITPTTPIRNGAARTSKLFPICCVNPTRTEDRWALPSSRSFRHPLQHQHAIQEDSDDSERGLSHKSKRGNIPTLSEDFVEIISYSPHASEDNLFPKQKSILKNSPRGSPRLAPSPRYGEHSRVIQNPQMRLSPRHGASPPQFIAPATMGAASKNNAVENLQEHAVVIATL